MAALDAKVPLLGPGPDPEPEPVCTALGQQRPGSTRAMPTPEEVARRRGLSKAERKAERKAEKKAAAAARRAAAREARPVPAPSLQGKSSVLPSSAARDERAGAELEREHVQAVYDSIASQWDATRYKAWPRVDAFIAGLPRGSLVCDSGAGNGKNLAVCAREGHVGVGSDFSGALTEISAGRGHESLVGDSTQLPYRDELFDAALSIAVLHHISSPARRRALIAETMRVVRAGGQALFYAWALEQREGEGGSRSGHRFGGQDVLVPFHYRTNNMAIVVYNPGRWPAAQHGVAVSQLRPPL
jgi:SAM-dependent methyltransferase